MPTAVLDALLALLVPPVCLACGRGARDVLCAACRASLPWLRDACPRCALPRPCAPCPAARQRFRGRVGAGRAGRAGPRARPRAEVRFPPRRRGRDGRADGRGARAWGVARAAPVDGGRRTRRGRRAARPRPERARAAAAAGVRPRGAPRAAARRAGRDGTWCAACAGATARAAGRRGAGRAAARGRGRGGREGASGRDPGRRRAHHGRDARRLRAGARGRRVRERRGGDLRQNPPTRLTSSPGSPTIVQRHDHTEGGPWDADRGQGP